MIQELSNCLLSYGSEPSSQIQGVFRRLGIISFLFNLIEQDVDDDQLELSVSSDRTILSVFVSCLNLIRVCLFHNPDAEVLCKCLMASQ